MEKGAEEEWSVSVMIWGLFRTNKAEPPLIQQLFSVGYR